MKPDVTEYGMLLCVNESAKKKIQQTSNFK